LSAGSTSFAYTFQTSRERVLGATIAFFLGVITTMVLLGTSVTAISGLIFSPLDTLTTISGKIVVTKVGEVNAAQLREQVAALLAGKTLQIRRSPQRVGVCEKSTIYLGRSSSFERKIFPGRS
jgi:cytochrome c biogenesis protein CcdA